jgi:hypothetical protein
MNGEDLSLTENSESRAHASFACFVEGRPADLVRLIPEEVPESLPESFGL